jgi:hypothetical protein
MARSQGRDSLKDVINGSVVPVLNAVRMKGQLSSLPPQSFVVPDIFVGQWPSFGVGRRDMLL